MIYGHVVETSNSMFIKILIFHIFSNIFKIVSSFLFCIAVLDDVIIIYIGNLWNICINFSSSLTNFSLTFLELLKSSRSLIASFHFQNYLQYQLQLLVLHYFLIDTIGIHILVFMKVYTLLSCNSIRKSPKIPKMLPLLPIRNLILKLFAEVSLKSCFSFTL